MNNFIAKDIVNQIRGYGNFFYVQWHITSSCTESCKHCYLDKNLNCLAFDLDNSKHIIDQVALIAKEKSKPAYIAFTGGDPLLHRNIFELIHYAREKEINVIIKGNPWLLTKDVALALKESGIKRYHLSIDGLENTHDSIRRSGSFRKTVEAISMLKSHNITVLTKFTVSKSNFSEMKEVMKFLSEIGVDIFDFQRYAPGDVTNSGLMLDKLSYKNLLFSILDEYAKIKENNKHFFLLFRDHLWLLLFKDMEVITDDFLDKIPKTNQALSGCSMASNNLVIINYNGDVLPCAKIPDYVIGNIHNNSLNSIIKSNKFSILKDIYNYKKCSQCSLGQLCRGCPAVSYYRDKNVFAEDPQCWCEACL